MQKLLDIIRVDLITMRGGKKNNLVSLAVVMLVFMLVGGFCFSPAAGSVMAPLIFAEFFPLMITQNELKYHGDKLWSVLPVSRRDQVSARFLLAVGSFAAATVIFYLLMLLSMTLKIYNQMQDEGEILEILAEKSGMSEFGLLTLATAFGFTLGILISANTLKQSLCDKESLASVLGIKSDDKKDKKSRQRRRKRSLYAVLAIVIVVLAELILSGLLPIGTALAFVMSIIGKIAEIGNGALLCAVLLTVALFHTAFCYVSTVIAYEDKEL